jgi:hypothetical protein
VRLLPKIHPMRRTIAIFAITGMMVPIVLLASWHLAMTNDITDQNRARLFVVSRVLWPTFGLIGPAVGDPASEAYVRQRYALAIAANMALYAALGSVFSLAHRWKKSTSLRL